MIPYVEQLLVMGFLIKASDKQEEDPKGELGFEMNRDPHIPYIRTLYDPISD